MTTNYSTDDIETKIMSILYANIDKKFSQFALFSKLINDKLPEFANTPIHPTIKAKFLLVLRTLASRYDDIIVTKENNMYYVVCLTNKDELNKVTNYTDNKELEQFMSAYNSINLSNSSNLNNSSNSSNSTNSTNSTDSTDSIKNPSSTHEQENLINYCDLLNYIIDNNLSDDINYVDPFDGNTIFHDLVITSNIQKITKLIVDGKFDFFIKNKQNKTPIELATNKTVENYLISKMIDKYLSDTLTLKVKIESDKKTIEDLTGKVILTQSVFFKEDIIVKTSIFDILIIKFIKFYEDNIFVFNGLFIIILAVIVFRIFC
jgi:hypothetical protein